MQPVTAGARLRATSDGWTDPVSREAGCKDDTHVCALRIACAGLKAGELQGHHHSKTANAAGNSMQRLLIPQRGTAQTLWFLETSILSCTALALHGVAPFLYQEYPIRDLLSIANSTYMQSRPGSAALICEYGSCSRTFLSSLVQARYSLYTRYSYSAPC